MAAILELDENLSKYFKVEFQAACWPCTKYRSQALMRIAGDAVSSLPRRLHRWTSVASGCRPDVSCNRMQVFEAAPQDARGVPAKKAAPDYFL